MRVYHLMPADYAIKSIQQRRLKASLFNELNDPFELLGMTLSDKRIRASVQKMKVDLAGTKGMHCFSRHWKNPVLWSHYADNHRGLCLGFDVPNHLLSRVRYVDERLPADALWVGSISRKIDLARRVLSTKFSHWGYEKEMRLFVELGADINDLGMHFTDFSSDLLLKEVIVGCESIVSRAEVAGAIGNQAGDVASFKARPAFAKFEVVRNRNERLWR